MYKARNKLDGQLYAVKKVVHLQYRTGAVQVPAGPHHAAPHSTSCRHAPHNREHSRDGQARDALRRRRNGRLSGMDTACHVCQPVSPGADVAHSRRRSLRHCADDATYNDATYSLATERHRRSVKSAWGARGKRSAWTMLQHAAMTTACACAHCGAGPAGADVACTPPDHPRGNAKTIGATLQRCRVATLPHGTCNRHHAPQ